MNWYHACIVLHFLAVLLWFGHMFFWTLFTGPVIKKIEPLPRANRLRELSFSVGGLGWPALAVLVITGTVMLGYRGAIWQDVISGALFQGRGGRLLATKFILVAGMVLYQAVFGHRPAPRVILVNMVVASGIVGLSVLFARV